MAVKRRGKVWQVDVSMGVGTRVRESYLDHTEAQKRDAELTHEYRQGKRQRGRLVGLSFGKVVALWLEESLAQHEPDTYRYYRERVQPSTVALGMIPLKQLGRLEVLEYIGTVKARSSPVTARKTLACIQTCIRWAITNELIEASPVISIPLPKVTPERRVDILTEDEFAFVMGAATPEPSVLCWKQRGMLLLMAHAGLRRREVKEFAIDWLHIDEHVIEVPAWAQFRPKSKRARLVPMSPELEAWADQWPEGRQYLLDGDRCIWQIRRLVQRAERMMEGRKRVTPHLLRHSYASMLSRRGASLEDIQAILGHSEIGTTARYIHALPGHVERVRKLVTSSVTSGRRKRAKLGTSKATSQRVKAASAQENRHN